MPLVARVTFVILVLSTFAAFFVAQRLKSEPPVINVPQITRYFSPNGDGKKDVSDIAFVIKVADEATVDVVNLDGDRVRRLIDSVPMQPNQWRRTSWDGKDDDGNVVPDGQYRLRVALRDEGRSAIVQKTMRVDTKAPTPAGVHRWPVLDVETAGRTSSPRATARSTSTSRAVPALRDDLPRLPHRPGRAEAGRPLPAQRPPRALGRARRRQAAGPGRLPHPGAGQRPGGQRGLSADGVRAGRRDGPSRA